MSPTDGSVVLTDGLPSYVMDTSGLGLYRSATGMDDWTVVPWSDGRNLTAFIPRPLTVSTVDPDGIWTSEDGVTFTQSSAESAHILLRENHIYAATATGVLVSRDAGATFSPTIGLPAAGTVVALAGNRPDLYAAVEASRGDSFNDGRRSSPSDRGRPTKEPCRT